MMRKHLRLFLTAALSLCSVAVISQSAGQYRHEIGIDISNVLTFLSKKNESCMLNYKWHFNEKNALRSGLDVDWSNGQEGYRIIGLRLGYERNLPVIANHWQLHYGVDGKFTYWSRNFMPNLYTRYGISPLIGITYFYSPHISISTDVGLNFLYTDYCNPENNIPEDNENVFEINVGYVGLLVVSYHF
jgi:hypothetical protein